MPLKKLPLRLLPLAILTALCAPATQAAPDVSPALEIPAEITALTPEQRTARLRAAVLEKDRLAEVVALLAAGADPLDQLRAGQPPFLTAIKAGQPAYAEAMLAARPRLCAEFWPDPHTRVTVGMVALYEALGRRQHVFARRLLVGEKIKPMAWRPEYDEKTPSALGHAVRGWDTETVRLLVAAGARFDDLPAGEGFFTLLEAYAAYRPTPSDLAREHESEERAARREAAIIERLRQKVADAATPQAKTSAEAVLRSQEAYQLKSRERDGEWKALNSPLEKIRLLASFRAPDSPKAATGVNDQRVDNASPLSLAVARGWPEVVAILVAGGADPRVGVVEQRSMLEYAADKPELLRALDGRARENDLRPTAGPDGAAYIAALATKDTVFLRDTPLTDALLSYRDPKGWSLLHHAINHHDDVFALRLIEAGADLEAATSGGQTPLVFAGFNARPEIARALLAKKASPHAPQDGLPPLAGACVGNDIEIMRLLLAAGADPRATYDGGVPLILCAAQHSSPEIIQVMLEHGATLDVATRLRAGPLEVTFFNDRADNLAWLLDHGARWRAAALSGETSPLLAATRQRAWRCARLLLERGEIDPRALPLASDPKFKAALEDKLQASGSVVLDDEELWPSICADGENGKARADAHLAKGGDVNYAGSNWTPLLKAFYAGDIGLVSHLVVKGADPKKHPREQMYADMITLAHLYQGTFGKPARLSLSEFMTYRAELIRLLAPLEPSDEYEHFLAMAVRTKRWEEIEAYVAVGAPTRRALDTVERMPDLKEEERGRLRRALLAGG